jgi:ribosomal protein L23
MSKTLVLKPRLSEKTYGMSETLNVYTFEVPKSATKHTIAAAIVAQYGDVTVKSVRIANVPGKTQRSYRRGGRNVRTGQRSDVHKAYVTLKEGDQLPIYAAVEEANPAAKENK